MVNPGRVLVATVAENREPFASEVVYLYKTLQRFGGHLARAQRVAYFVRSVDSQAAKRLADLNVMIKIVKPVDLRCPHANKIRMLDDAEDFDHLVALDTDIVIARDFSPYLQGSSVAAKPAGRTRLTRKEWKKLFEYFGLKIPLARYTTTATMKETIPYFNSGVILVPNKYVSLLREAWESFIARILNDLPEISSQSVFIDQFALSLALVGGRLPYRALPLEMNFPTDRQVHAALGPERLAPYILHHHHRVSQTGEVLPCSYENANILIGEINQYLRSNELGGPA